MSLDEDIAAAVRGCGVCKKKQRLTISADDAEAIRRKALDSS